MKINGIIGALLAFSIILVAPPSNAENVTDLSEGGANNEAIETVVNLGIMTGRGNGIFAPGETLTRAEFAQILTNIYGAADESGDFSWNDMFLGGEDKELALKIPLSQAQYFADVPASHWAYGAVYYVAAYGLMNGVSEYMFEPDRAVSYDEAVKTAVRILGFEVRAQLKGGYPSGYIAVAASLGILTGLNGNMTRGDMARLLYNCLDITLLQRTGFGDDSVYERKTGETLLSEIMKIYHIKGQMTANYAAATDGSPTLRKGDIVVNGTLISTNNADYAGDYIGRVIHAYYTGEEGGEKNLVFAKPAKERVKAVIDAEDFLEFEDNKFKYYVNERETYAAISPGTTVIYNGSVIESYGSGSFIMEEGSITVYEDPKLVVVKNYETVYVSYVDSGAMEIFNNLGGVKTISLDDGDMIVKVKNTVGELKAFDDITVGSVCNIALGEKSAEVIISENMLNGAVEEISSEDGETVLIIAGVPYKISKKYIESEHYSEFTLNDGGVFYLDAFNKISWYDKSGNSGDKSAYFIESGLKPGIDSRCRLKIYDFALNKVTVMTVSDKVKISLSDGTETSASGSQIPLYLDGIVKFFTYNANLGGEITAIKIPLDKDSENAGMRVILETDNAEESPYYYYKYAYKNSVKGFGGKLFLNDATKILQVPADKGEDADYSLIAMSALKNGVRLVVNGYTEAGDSPLAQYAVIEGLANLDTITATDKAMVVTKISTAADADGLPVLKVTGYQHNAEVTLYAEYDRQDANGEKRTVFDLAQDPFKQTGVYYKTEVGDIIRYAVGTKAKYADMVQMIYKANAENPAWTNGVKGMIAGSGGKYLSTATDGNPYSFNDTPSALQNAQGFNTGTFKVLYGYVYSKSGNYINVTTQDLLSGEYNAAPSDYVNQTYNAGAYTATNAVYSSYGVTAGKGGVTDIKAYKEVGESCSRVIVIEWYGDPTQLIVINNK